MSLTFGKTPGTEYYVGVPPTQLDAKGLSVLNLPAPSVAKDAATKSYVDTTTSAVASAQLDARNRTVLNLPAPANSNDVATKSYVDTNDATTKSYVDTIIPKNVTFIFDYTGMSRTYANPTGGYTHVYMQPKASSSIYLSHMVTEKNLDAWRRVDTITFRLNYTTVTNVDKQHDMFTKVLGAGLRFAGPGTDRAVIDVDTVWNFSSVTDYADIRAFNISVVTTNRGSRKATLVGTVGR